MKSVVLFNELIMMNASRNVKHVHDLPQYSTVQYSTIQYSTVQYSTVQYSTVRYSTIQCADTIKQHNTPKKYPIKCIIIE